MPPGPGLASVLTDGLPAAGCWPHGGEAEHLQSQEGGGSKEFKARGWLCLNPREGSDLHLCQSYLLYPFLCPPLLPTPYLTPARLLRFFGLLNSLTTGRVPYVSGSMAGGGRYFERLQGVTERRRCQATSNRGPFSGAGVALPRERV